MQTAILTAQAQAEAALASIESGTAEIAAADARVETAKLNLSYTRVISPTNGRAGRRYVDAGNLVGSTEKTLLTKIVRYDPIYAEFTINENDLLAIMRITAEKSKIDKVDRNEISQPVFVGLGNEEGFPHRGVVDYADLAIDESTGTYLIRATIENHDLLIPPGAFLRIQVPRGEVEALLIDELAIGRDQAGVYVLVVNDDNMVERRSVTLGGKYDSLRAISSPDVGEQDRIVVNGVQFARPGSKVTPEERAAAGSPAEPPQE